MPIKIEERYPPEFEAKFEVLDKIGKGCQGGVVCQVRERETGLLFAAKIYRTNDEERISLVFSQLLIMFNKV